MNNGSANRNSTSVPAHAREAETSLPGELMICPDFIPEVMAIISADDIHLTAEREVVRAIFNVHLCGDPVDGVTVAEWLHSAGKFDAVGGEDGLNEMLGRSHHAAHAVHHARMIAEKALRRRLDMELTDARRMLCDESVETADIIHFVGGLVAHVNRDNGPERCTVGALQQKYPTLSPPVINGLVREAETLNIVSTTKVGKSWLAYNLLLCVIMGHDWLNRFETTSGKVLLIDNELQPATLAARIRTVADAMGIPHCQYADEFEVWPVRGKGLDVFAIGRMLDRVPAGTFKIVVIDAKYRALPADSSENDNAHETQFYNEIDRIAERLRAVFVLVHHSTKGAQADKRVTDVGAGGGAQSRAADAHVVLREHEEPDTVVLEAAVRSFPPVDPVGLRWTFPLWIADESIETGSLKGKTKPESPSSTYGREVQLSSDRGTVLRILGELADPQTKTTIRTLTGLSGPRFNQAFIHLFDEGVISESTVVRANGQRYGGFILTSAIGQHPSASVNFPLTSASVNHQSGPLKGGALTDGPTTAAQTAPVNLTDENSDGWETGAAA